MNAVAKRLGPKSSLSPVPLQARQDRPFPVCFDCRVTQAYLRSVDEAE
jgi:hypothetical protein